MYYGLIVGNSLPIFNMYTQLIILFGNDGNEILTEFVTLCKIRIGVCSACSLLVFYGLLFGFGAVRSSRIKVLFCTFVLGCSFLNGTSLFFVINVTLLFLFIMLAIILIKHSIRSNEFKINNFHYNKMQL